jgi:hypothetical protein
MVIVELAVVIATYNQDGKEPLIPDILGEYSFN